MVNLAILETLIYGSNREEKREYIKAGYINGCGMDNIIRARDLVLKETEENKFSKERMGLALEYGTIKSLAKLHDIEAVSKALDDISEKWGMEYGEKPTEGRVYTVMRVIRTYADETNSSKCIITYVPWSSKDGRRRFLECNGGDDDYDRDDQEAIDNMIRIATSMTKSDKYTGSITDLSNIRFIDPVGYYFNHNWHKYADKARLYSSDFEIYEHSDASWTNTVTCTLYRVEL